MSGVVRAIFLRPAARLPVQRVAEAEAVAGVGLAGDHAGGGRRQITLLAEESWRDACGELGADVDPAVRRANVLVAGVDLAAAIGAVLQIGVLRIAVEGETRPCELLDGTDRMGLCAALRGAQRGGVYGRLLCGGTLRVGDAVQREDTVRREDAVQPGTC